MEEFLREKDMKQINLKSISVEESKEVEKIYEDLNTSKVLFKLLATSDKEYIRNELLYFDIKKDYEIAQKKYSNWWSDIVERYGLDKSKQQEYVVDFNSHVIFKFQE